VSKENGYNKMLKFFSGSDMDFYEEMLENLTEEEIKRFMEANPDFLDGDKIDKETLERIKEESLQEILKQISEE